MNRRHFLQTLGLTGAAVSVGSSCYAKETDPANNLLVSNPYQEVDWEQVQRLRSQLHMHTLQSDGHHLLDEVVGAYQNANYDLLAITDHDLMKPNRHVKSGRVPAERASPWPTHPLPPNYPANTTWPWTQYGGKSPEEYGLIGVEANELTYQHHINSYFCSVGFSSKDYDKRLAKRWCDMEIEAIAEAGGLAVLLHPGWGRESHRHPLEWYVERFTKHSADTLIGLEVTNVAWKNRFYDQALWDQLLARFMPNRPIWGFGTDDMHRLESARQSFSILLAEDRSPAAARKAMSHGRLFFCRSSNSIDLRPAKFVGYDPFPEVKRVNADDKSGIIEIEATGYDRIEWISSPTSLEPNDADYKTSAAPFPKGKIVHEGSSIDIKDTAGISNYLRVELVSQANDHEQRTFLNPFGIRAGFATDE